jgi:hypothetical protein
VLFNFKKVLIMWLAYRASEEAPPVTHLVYCAVAGGTTFECEHTLGASKPKSWLGPTYIEQSRFLSVW